jgi:hypothetical protein
MKTGLSFSSSGNTQVRSAEPPQTILKPGPGPYRNATPISRSAWRNYLPAVLCTLLLGIAILRVSATYRVLSQAYDEPADVVAGMEWLDKGTYTLNLEHPPLSPVATAIGPYLAGLRLEAVPVVQSPKGPFFDLPSAGNNILYSGSKYWRNLSLARLGILPFLALGALVVFLWTRELVGTTPAILAVALFTTLPPILAFSGFAYTDMPVAVLVFTSAFIFTRWIDRPHLRTTIALGVVTALAVLANFPALLYVPACWAAVVFGWYGFAKKTPHCWSLLLRRSVLVAVAFFLVLWAGYRFSVQPLGSVFNQPASHIASLRLPAPGKRLLQGLVALNPPVPFPSLVRGIAAVKHDTGQGRESYLLGRTRRGGWWYFYLVVLAVKTPLSFLLLALLGAIAMVRAARRAGQWTLLIPTFCVLALLLITMPVKVNYGVRHILCIYIPLAMLAGYGAMQLWNQQAWRLPARLILIGLLGWQILSSARAHPAYVAYMNELVGSHPEKVLLWGCDYDCGQDTARLGQLLQQKHVSHVSLAVFSSVDFAKLGFPSFDVLAPYQQPSGWVAASTRMILTGDAFLGGTHPDAFLWLQRCRPMARAGETIFLYYLPCEHTEDLMKGRPN